MNFMYLLLCASICSQTLFAAQKNTHPRDEETQRSNQRRKIETAAAQDEAMEDSENNPASFESLQNNAINNINVITQNQNTTTSSSQAMHDTADEKTRAEHDELFDEPLLKADEDENDEDTNIAALMWAAQNNDIPLMRELIASGVNLDAQDLQTDTALAKAVNAGNVEAVDELLNAGADVNGAEEFHILRYLWLDNDLENADDARKAQAAQILIRLMLAGATIYKDFWQDLKKYPYLLQAINDYNNKKNALVREIDRGMGEVEGAQDLSRIIASYAHEPIAIPGAEEEEKKETENNNMDVS